MLQLCRSTIRGVLPEGSQRGPGYRGVQLCGIHRRPWLAFLLIQGLFCYHYYQLLFRLLHSLTVTIENLNLHCMQRLAMYVIKFLTAVNNTVLWVWQVRLGPNGAEEVLGLGNLSDYEQKGLEALKSELMSSIQKGVDFINVKA